MKTTKIAAAILGLALSGAALAAGSTAATTSTSKASVWQKLKESPASLNILSATDFNKRADHKINGATMTNIVYLGWKLSDKDSLRLENRWTTKKTWQAPTKKEREFDTTYARQVLKYQRTGILNQKEHGINLKAAMEYRYLPDAKTRQQANYHSLFRPSVSASRSFDNGFGLSGTLYYAKKLNFRTKEQGTGTDYLYLVTTQSFSFTDKLSLSITEEFFHSYVKGREYAGVNDYSEVSVSAELGYSFNPAIYAGISVATTPFKAHDQRTTAVDWLKKAGYGFNVYMSVF